MLSFEQKIAIVDSFPQLERKNVSLGRVNYHYEVSALDKKTVVYHLHPNGNGFVYAGHFMKFNVDDKGFVNIRDYSEEKLRSIIEQSIQSMTRTSALSEESSVEAELIEEYWVNAENQELVLQLENEDQKWYLYAGDDLEEVFDTYDEASEYLKEEKFSLR
ncbi:hypothetical protein NV379_00830 [Paenibacillus sp. N1-5-1-14]|uniref:hypothetical protein n=1 Tax=Paenibacillus radicibacter TaxID=2972488 RepID=UPI0021597763|nr:hypothetical protein [Paenibacillus radicibacter]MCR8641187.1 hypothetical protein [Paenibacillus radicibacter]